MTERAAQARRTLIEAGFIDRNDRRSLASIACQYCLDAGIDHVLVGMRDVDYVDDLRPLFQPRRSTIAKCVTTH
jgi:hypothetical protein